MMTTFCPLKPGGMFRLCPPPLQPAAHQLDEAVKMHINAVTMQKPNKIQDLYRQLGGLEARNEMLIDQVKELEQRNRDLEQKKEQLFKDLANAKLDALHQHHVAHIDATVVTLNFKEDLAEAKTKEDSLELQLNRANDEVLVEQQNRSKS